MFSVASDATYILSPYDNRFRFERFYVQYDFTCIGISTPKKSDYSNEIRYEKKCESEAKVDIINYLAVNATNVSLSYCNYPSRKSISQKEKT